MLRTVVLDGSSFLFYISVMTRDGDVQGEYERRLSTRGACKTCLFTRGACEAPYGHPF